MNINVELATKIGLKESLLLEHLKKLQGQQNNFEFGEFWAEASLISLQKTFPFFNETEIRRILGRLEKNGLIKSYRANTIRVAKRYSVKEL